MARSAKWLAMAEAHPDDPAPRPDGRHLRRERGREAVMDGLIELLFEGVLFPNAQQIAERAGVSHMSVYRYFEGVGELRDAALSRWLSSNTDVLQIDVMGVGDRTGRIERLVDARLGLYETAEPLARLFRVRSQEVARADAIHRFLHVGYVAQITEHFGVELAPMVEREAARLVGAIATLTSFESWDLLREYHDFDRGEIHAVWSSAVDALTR